jgi:hypothetical protein
MLTLVAETNAALLWSHYLNAFKRAWPAVALRRAAVLTRAGCTRCHIVAQTDAAVHIGCWSVTGDCALSGAGGKRRSTASYDAAAAATLGGQFSKRHDAGTIQQADYIKLRHADGCQPLSSRVRLTVVAPSAHPLICAKRL